MKRSTLSLSPLSLSIAAALAAGFAGPAAAYAPTSPLDADYNIYFAGATASNLTLRQTIIEQVCDPAAGDIDEFNDGPATNPNDWAVACTVTTASVPGVTLTPARIIFHKTNRGGSGTGVGPVESEAALQYAVISTGGATPNCNTPTAQVSPDGTAFERWVCGALKEARIPDGGTSDIEPNKFFGINTPVADTNGDGINEPVPFLNLGNLDVFSLAHLAFGIPVTKELRDALQATQFPVTSACHPQNGGYAANAETEACMPNLTKEHVRSIMAGRVANWNQLQVEQRDPVTGAPLGTVAGLYTEATTKYARPLQTDTNVQICRRVEGSGTQAQFNAIFMGWPCDLNTDGAIDVVEPAKVSNALGGPKVVLNSGSGDVRRCLNDYNNGTATMTAPVKPDPAATKRWAIGVQSLENNANLADAYRFIKINGSAPTLKNMHNGQYDDWAAQSMQWRKDETTYVWGVPRPVENNNQGNASKGADIKRIFNFLKDSWITVSSIVSLNVNYNHSFGQSGWLVEGKTTLKPDNILNPARPVATYTRSPAGAPNHCQAPVKPAGTTITTNLLITPTP
jgi:ABC-type phosphate transport system substrate-binding protein